MSLTPEDVKKMVSAITEIQEKLKNPEVKETIQKTSEIAKPVVVVKKQPTPQQLLDEARSALTAKDFDTVLARIGQMCISFPSNCHGCPNSLLSRTHWRAGKQIAQDNFNLFNADAQDAMSHRGAALLDTRRALARWLNDHRSGIPGAKPQWGVGAALGA